MKNLVLMILTITLINNSFAQSTVLEEGQSAPYKGVLLTPERAEKAMKAEKAKAVLEDLKVTHESIITYHKKDAQIQREKLSEAKFKSHIYNIGYFLLGVVITSYAYKINQEIQK